MDEERDPEFQCVVCGMTCIHMVGDEETCGRKCQRKLIRARKKALDQAIDSAFRHHAVVDEWIF